MNKIVHCIGCNEKTDLQKIEEHVKVIRTPDAVLEFTTHVYRCPKCNSIHKIGKQSS